MPRDATQHGPFKGPLVANLLMSLEAELESIGKPTARQLPQARCNLQESTPIRWLVMDQASLLADCSSLKPSCHSKAVVDRSWTPSDSDGRPRLASRQNIPPCRAIQGHRLEPVLEPDLLTTYNTNELPVYCNLINLGLQAWELHPHSLILADLNPWSPTRDGCFSAKRTAQSLTGGARRTPMQDSGAANGDGV